MQCHDVHEWMSLKLDGRLPPDQEQEMQAHLALCPACAEEWATWRHLAVLFEGAPLAQPPEDFAVRVLAHLHAGPHWGALLASLVATMAGLIFIAALFLAPWAPICRLALSALQVPGMLQMASRLLADLVHPAAVAAEALRVALRALLTPQSALAALCYGAVFLAALVGWLRVAVFRTAGAVRWSDPQAADWDRLGR